MAAPRAIFGVDALTGVERRALVGLSSGLTRVQLAEELSLSPYTVGHMLTQAKEKLGARTLTQAAVMVVLAEEHRPDGKLVGASDRLSHESAVCLDDPADAGYLAPSSGWLSWPSGSRSRMPWVSR